MFIISSSIIMLRPRWERKPEKCDEDWTTVSLMTGLLFPVDPGGRAPVREAANTEIGRRVTGRRAAESRARG